MVREDTGLLEVLPTVEGWKVNRKKEKGPSPSLKEYFLGLGC